MRPARQADAREAPDLLEFAFADERQRSFVHRLRSGRKAFETRDVMLSVAPVKMKHTVYLPPSNHDRLIGCVWIASYVASDERRADRIGRDKGI